MQSTCNSAILSAVMSKFFTVSFLLHLAVAAFVVIGVPALRLAKKDRISVAVILDSPSGLTNSVARKNLVPRSGPRSMQTLPQKPATPPTPQEPAKLDHYHADATDVNAVAEGPEAHKPSETSAAASEENSSTHAHGALDENSAYVRSVIEIVTKAKRYPKISQDREEEGLVLLAVALASDGSVNDVRIELTCPFERLNRAAVDTVRGIAKFPPPPGVSPSGIATLHIPIRYKLTRR
jgi:protein TonB